MEHKFILNQNRIDSIQSVKLDSLTFEDVYYHYGTGVGFTEMRNHEKVSRYRHGVGTNIGDIERRVWKQIVYHLIAKAGEEELFEQLKEYVAEVGFFRDKEELEMDALQLHSYRIFEDLAWVGFVPFNRRYRPEYLKDFPLIAVACDCCQKPGEVTEEQLAKAIDGKINCPACGIGSTYRIICKK